MTQRECQRCQSGTVFAAAYPGVACAASGTRKGSDMQEMQPWHYVVATEAMLAAVGVSQATAVQYDTTRGLFELLDDSAGCNEGVVRTADNNQVWIDRFNTKFGITPIYMDDSMIRDFDADYVHITYRVMVALCQ